MIDYSEEVMELRTELARLREVAQMALSEMEESHWAVADKAPHRDVMRFNEAMVALRKELE